MKKTIITLIISIIFLGNPLDVKAANTYSLLLVRGSSQYATVTDADSISYGEGLMEDITVEAWINLATLPSPADTEYFIIAKSASNQTTGYSLRVYNEAGTQRMVFSANTGAQKSHYYAWADIATGTWYHVAGSRDHTTGEIVLYINGTSVASATKDSGFGVDNGADMGIGYNLVVANTYFDGYVDEVRIWKEVRTPTEIDNNKCLQIDSDTNLQASWHFDNSAADSSGNSNTATLVNSPTYNTNIPSCFSAGTAAPNRNLYNAASQMQIID